MNERINNAVLGIINDGLGAKGGGVWGNGDGDKGIRLILKVSLDEEGASGRERGGRYQIKWRKNENALVLGQTKGCSALFSNLSPS